MQPVIQTGAFAMPFSQTERRMWMERPSHTTCKSWRGDPGARTRRGLGRKIYCAFDESTNAISMLPGVMVPARTLGLVGTGRNCSLSAPGVGSPDP